MVTTLIPTPTTRPSVSPRPAAFVSAAAAAFAAPSTTASSFVATNRWLGGGDAFGCGNHEGMYGTKRIHPGRLGGMT